MNLNNPAWPQIRTYQLIEEYRKRELLWKNEYIRNKSAVAVWERAQEWGKIANILNSALEYKNWPVTAATCKNRIYRIRIAFRARRREIKINIEKGIDPEYTAYNCRFKNRTNMEVEKIYEALDFLRHNDQHHKAYFKSKEETIDTIAEKEDNDGTSSSNVQTKEGDASNININMVKKAPSASEDKIKDEDDESNTSVRVKIEYDLSTSDVTIEKCDAKLIECTHTQSI